MQICYAISGFFAAQAAVSVVSALENNNKDIVSGVVIAGSSLSDKDINLFEDICKKYDRKFKYVDADKLFKEKYDEMQLKGYGGYIAPWLFICPHLLADPEDERFLMLDADTVVVGSLKELCDLDMNGKVLAGVISVNNYKKHIVSNELKTITGNERYYNYGVILYNLPEWNSKKCWDRVYETCIKYHPIDVVEQTLMNNSIPDSMVQTLSPKYNYWGHKYKNKEKIYYELAKGGWYNEEIISDAIENPVIIHYKDWFSHPWHKDAITTLGYEYDKYSQLLPQVPNTKETSIFSEIEHVKGLARVKKNFFFSIEKINSLWMTKIAENFVELCQKIKMMLWRKK